jgi:outer membrane protein assembly factor BamB
VYKINVDAFQDNTIAVSEFVYTFHWSGMPVCVNWKTGETAWKSRAQGRGKAAITFADGHLDMRHSDGVVSLAEANPEKFFDKGSSRIPGYQRASSSTFPVVAGGRLYLRDDDRLFCYNIREDAYLQPRPEPETIVLSKPKAHPERDRFRERSRRKASRRKNWGSLPQ